MHTESRSWRSVVLPSEHGGWSLTLEPALLGMIIRPSLAGMTLAFAALVAFVLRTPLKLWLGDRWRKRSTTRTPLAARAAVGYGIALVALLLAAAAVADAGFWVPLLAATPLFVLELAYDIRARGRRLIPELAGTIGVGSVAAAIVLAGGAAPSLAIGIWAIVTARVVASIPYVRLQLRRAKCRPHRTITSDAAQGVAATIAGLTVAVTPVPTLGLVAIAAAAIWHLSSVRLPVTRAVVVGAQQVVIGLTVVLVTGLAVLAP